MKNQSGFIVLFLCLILCTVLFYYKYQGLDRIENFFDYGDVVGKNYVVQPPFKIGALDKPDSLPKDLNPVEISDKENTENPRKTADPVSPGQTVENRDESSSFGRPNYVPNKESEPLRPMPGSGTWERVIDSTPGLKELSHLPSKQSESVVPRSKKQEKDITDLSVPQLKKEKSGNLSIKINPTTSTTTSGPHVTPHPCSQWSSTGLVMPMVRGRLGNQMGEYASTLSLAKIKGAKPVITTGLRDFLSLFPNLSVKLYKRDLNHECVSSFYKVNPERPWKEREVAKSDYIYLDYWPFVPEWFHAVEDELRHKEFVYSNTMIRQVNDFLYSTVVVNGNRTDLVRPIFIGVHVRRADYEQFLKKLYHASLSLSLIHI